MGDHNKPLLPQSSPKHSISGNDENENENQRNSQQKSKNFMSPTIPTASKFTSNNKVFTEWKSSPKSGIGELGNSNSSIRKSVPKIPKIKNVEYYDNAEFVGESLDVPYDPLTNYLSPRPRFLRYRPRRRREILVKRVEKERERDGTESTDSDSSIESVDSSSEKEKEIEENRGSDENVVITEEVEDVDDCDDYVEEEGSGFKWVFLKSLVAVLAVFLCTLWICSMNSSDENTRMLLDNRMYDVMGMNMSLRIVSLRNLDSRMGVFDVESDEKLNRVDLESVVSQEIENLEIMESVDDYFQRDIRFLNDDYHFRDGDVEFKVENVSDEGNEVHGLKTESVEVEIEALNTALEVNDGTEGEPMGVVVFEEIDADVGKDEAYDSKSDGEHVTTEAPIVASDINEINEVYDSKSDEEHVTIKAPVVASDINESIGMVHYDFEAEYRSLVLGNEVVNASEYSDRVIEEKKGIDSETSIDSETVIEVSESKPKDGELANETVEFEPKFEKKQLKLLYNDLIWPVISPLIALSLLLCFTFYCKCKRTFSKTRPAKWKLCLNAAGKTVKSKPGLPPKAVEKKTDQSQLNAPLVQKGVNNEVMIPTVKQLGEFDVAVDFTRPLKGCSVKTEMDETGFASPDTKRVLRRGSVSGPPLSSELSTAESYSCGSFILRKRRLQRLAKKK